MHGPPAMTSIPSSRARSTAASLSAPGCIHKLFTPAAAACSTTCSVTSGGVMIDTDSTGSGRSAKLLKAGAPRDLRLARVHGVGRSAGLSIAEEYLCAVLRAVVRRADDGEGGGFEKVLDRWIHGVANRFRWRSRSGGRLVGR